MKTVNIYDFDGTIYDGDSTIDFYLYCLKRNKRIIKYIPIQGIYFILYKLKIKSKKEFKEKFFIFLNSIDNISKYVDDFWKVSTKKIKTFYMKSEHDKDIIISASPYFLISKIGKILKVYDVIATNVQSKGNISGNNCHGIEKVKRFKEKYPKVIIDKVYTDSLSDLPILELGKKAYLVKKNDVTEYHQKGEKNGKSK